MTDRELKTITAAELEQHVQSALDWEPSVDAKDIGISVDAGIVTLRGSVGSYMEKLGAERAVLRVYGVRAIANDLVVQLGSGHGPTDTEIAQAAVAALTWNATIPKERITVTVKGGQLTLNGTLDWHYQKDAAAQAVRNFTGVTEVVNDITVKPRVKTWTFKTKSKPPSGAVPRLMQGTSA